MNTGFLRGAAASILALSMAAGSASAQCGGYAFSQTTGTIEPGVDDIGNHGDDLTTQISLPFDWNYYGVSYNTATVSSNGNIQFGGLSAAYFNDCIPSATVTGPTLMPHWDDLRTDMGSGPGGIYTSTTGSAPNRIFNIEWRVVYFADTATELNFEVRLYEGSGRVDFVYGNVPNQGVSATIGVQSGSAAPDSQFSCSTASLGGVQVIRWDCDTNPYPPRIAGNAAIGGQGNPVLLTANYIPGGNPTSTNPVVRADLSGIGASATQLMYDDGSNGDVSAGDSVFSYTHPLTLSSPLGLNTINLSATDAQGRTGNGTLALTILPPPPTNDNCSDALTVTAGSYPFETLSAINDGTGSCGGSATSPDIWYRFVAPNAGNATFSLCGSGYDTVLSLLDGCGGNELVCNDDFCGLQSSIQYAVGAQQVIFIRVSGFLDDTGAGTLTITDPVPPPQGVWNEAIDGGGDAGELTSDAQVVTGNGPLPQIVGTLNADTDTYKIRICDVGGFGATLVNNALFDTQLFLFDANGMGVTSDDDSQGTLQSTLTAQFITAEGDYYLSISGYNRDPDSEAGLIWNSTPFNVERAPDGPGAGGALIAWEGFGGSGQYAIDLTGACHSSACQRCVADFDDGSGLGHPDCGVTLDDLLYYLAIYGEGNVRADVDNGTFTGTQDGGVTLDDLLYFLFHYDLGC